MGTAYDDWLKKGGASNKDTGEGIKRWQEKNPTKTPFSQAKKKKKKNSKNVDIWNSQRRPERSSSPTRTFILIY